MFNDDPNELLESLGITPDKDKNINFNSARSMVGSKAVSFLNSYSALLIRKNTTEIIEKFSKIDMDEGSRILKDAAPNVMRTLKKTKLELRLMHMEAIWQNPDASLYEKIVELCEALYRVLTKSIFYFIIFFIAAAAAFLILLGLTNGKANTFIRDVSNLLGELKDTITDIMYALTRGVLTLDITDSMKKIDKIIDKFFDKKKEIERDLKHEGLDDAYDLFILISLSLGMLAAGLSFMAITNAVGEF